MMKYVRILKTRTSIALRPMICASLNSFTPKIIFQTPKMLKSDHQKWRNVKNTVMFAFRACVLQCARAHSFFYETIFCMYGNVLVTICKKIHVDISIRAGVAYCANFVPLTWKSVNPLRLKTLIFCIFYKLWSAISKQYFHVQLI